jgi:hypothetical protein
MLGTVSMVIRFCLAAVAAAGVLIGSACGSTDHAATPHHSNTKVGSACLVVKQSVVSPNNKLIALAKHAHTGSLGCLAVGATTTTTDMDGCLVKRQV